MRCDALEVVVVAQRDPPGDVAQRRVAVHVLEAGLPVRVLDALHALLIKIIARRHDEPRPDAAGHFCHRAGDLALPQVPVTAPVAHDHEDEPLARAGRRGDGVALRLLLPHGERDERGCDEQRGQGAGDAPRARGR
jgi:hypothetical protein